MYKILNYFELKTVQIFCKYMQNVDVGSLKIC